MHLDYMFFGAALSRSLRTVNGFKDQFNCHKFTVKDINARIDSISKEMETKALLQEAGLTYSDLHFVVKKHQER